MSGVEKVRKMYSQIESIMDSLYSINSSMKDLKDVYITLKNDVRVRTGDLDSIKKELEEKVRIASETREQSNQLISEYESDIAELDLQLSELSGKVNILYSFNPEIDSKDLVRKSTLSPYAKAFVPSPKLNPNAKSFSPGMNPNAKEFTPSPKLNPNAKSFSPGMNPNAKEFVLNGGKKNKKSKK